MTGAEARKYEADIDDAFDAGDLNRAEERADAYRGAAEMSSHPEPARDPRWRAAYYSGQVALAAGRPGAALDLLLPLRKDAPRLPAELAARLLLLLAEAHARRGQAAEARPLLRALPPGLLDREPLLAVRLLRVRLLLDELPLLGDALARCDAALERRGDDANRALLACDEGRAWDRAGDLARAAECWRKAERLTAASSGTDAIRADVLLQLGRLEHLCGRLGPALERFEAALRHAAAGGQTLELRLRVLLVRLDLNQWEQVRAAADALLSGVDPLRLPEEVRPLAAMVRGLLDGRASDGATPEEAAYHAAKRGDTAAAVALYHSAFAAVPSPERRARLALALGLLAMGHSDRAEARSWLAHAEELARSLGLPEVLRRTLQVCGQLAAEQQGDDERARTFFEEAHLLAEVQAGQLTPDNAQTYLQDRTGVLRSLLRSACRRGDIGAAFRYQELERGRFLLGLLRAAPARAPLLDQPDVAAVEADIAACDRELEALGPVPDAGKRHLELLRRRAEGYLRRDRLFEEFLRDCQRADNAVLPALPGVADLRRSLAPGTVYAAPVLAEDELFLLAVRGDGPETLIRAEGSARSLCAALDDLRDCLTAQTERYRRGFPVGPPERAELDTRLESLGAGPLGAALEDALGEPPARRVVWVPDGALHGVPVHALRRRGRYFIEAADFVWTFSASLLVHQGRSVGRRWPLRPAVAVTEDPSELPEAAREGAGAVGSFLRGRLLPPRAADRASLRAWLARARAVHFACHAEFDGRRPLAARLRLPSGESVYALEWLAEPVDGLALVTLSACRAGEVAPLLGREVFGHVTGLLGGGVRSVLAGLWPVADRESRPLMWRFYRHRLLHDLPSALALAQREALARPDGSPLFWAPYALFGDPAALPAPGVWTRWLARLRQSRHRRRFPVDE
jgi:tetratricopeptide (TPR) repeat protein